MHPYNYDLDNIELYSLVGVSLVDLINEYNGKILKKNDKLWLRESSRGGRGGNDVENIGKLYLIFTIILEMDLFRLKHELRDFYKNLSRKKMQMYIPNANDINIIKRLLKASGVVDINEKSSSGKFSHGFRINPKHQYRRRVALYELQDKQYYFLQSTYENWHKKKKGIKTVKVKALDDSAVKPIKEYGDKTPLFNWLKKCHSSITIDKAKAKAALDKKLVNGELTGNAYDVAYGVVEKIEEWGKTYSYEPKFDRSEATGRITSDVNLISRITRPFLRYKNHPIFWIDINACHPFLLLNLYKTMLAEVKDEGLVKKIKSEQKKYYKLWSRFHVVSIKGKPTRINDFYRSFIELGGLDMSRGKLKSAMMEDYLYTAYRDKRLLKVGKVIRNEFQLLDGYLKKVKTTKVLPSDDLFWNTYDDRLAAKRHERELRNKRTKRYVPPQSDILYGQLSYINMRLESKAVIQIAAKKFMDEFGQKSFMLTLHDALGVQQKKIPFARKVLIEAFEQVTGRKPKIKKEEDPDFDAYTMVKI